MTEAEVAVVGAGLAGLSAALCLQSAGIAVRVVEAREEVGGRVRSRVIDGQACELGAMFFGRRHERLRRLLREYRLTYGPSGLYGAPLRWGITTHEHTGRLAPLNVGELAALLRVTAPWAAPTGRLADQQSFGSWLDDQRMGAGARQLLALVVGGFASVPADRLCSSSTQRFPANSRNCTPKPRSPT